MLAGFIIIIAGVLIALHPPFLIMVGALMLTSAWHRRRLARHSGESIIQMILRY